MSRCARCPLKLTIGFLIGFVASQALFETWRYSGCRMHKNEKEHDKTCCKTDSEKLVFAGVMTTRKYLQTRADTIYKTWGKDFPGELVFFIGTGEDLNTSLPVVVLTNVTDEAYPPQRKSFEMLRYMAKHHGNDFHWFLRLDDDIYVNTNLLKTFLTSVNSSLHEYMGHPGLGTKKEKGHLGLHGKTPYCLGGPGVILSGPILRQVAPHLSNCLKNPVTPHEDTELGRCVYKVTGLSCTRQNKFVWLFRADTRHTAGEWAVRMNPHQALKTLSFHPVKHPAYQFLLHKMILLKTLEEKHSYKLLLEREASPIITSSSVKAAESTQWTCINASNVYSLEAGHLKDSTLHRGRHLGLVSVRKALEPFLKKKKLRVSQIAYQRVSAPNGLEHVLVTTDRKNNYWTFRTRQNFRHIYFRELKSRKR
ncbi:chondroitin sulfate synthase 1-like isoform X2 [Haliotis asinina]